MKSIGLILIIFFSFLDSTRSQNFGCSHETHSDSLFQHSIFTCDTPNYEELSEKFAIDFLIEKIRTGNSEDKIRAAKILTIKEDESTFPIIHQLLLDNDERVVSSTITFLKFMNREESSIPIFNIVKRRDEFENKKMAFYAIDALKAISDSLILNSLIHYNQKFNAINHYEKSLKNRIEKTIEFIQQFHGNSETKRNLLLAEVSNTNVEDWILNKIIETKDNEFWVSVLREQSREKIYLADRLSLLRTRISMKDIEFNAEEQELIKHYQLDKN